MLFKRYSVFNFFIEGVPEALKVEHDSTKLVTSVALRDSVIGTFQGNLAAEGLYPINVSDPLTGYKIEIGYNGSRKQFTVNTIGGVSYEAV